MSAARDLDDLSIFDIYRALGGETSDPKQSRGEAFVRCLGHKPDNHPSLRLNEAKGVFCCSVCGDEKGGGKLKLIVFAGAASDSKSAWRWLIDRGVVAELERHNGSFDLARPRGDALEQLAALKRLPIDYLRKHGLSTHSGGGIAISYRHEDGTPTRPHVRKTPETSHPSWWGMGGKGTAGEIMPYGLWHRPRWREEGHKALAIVEGETDSLTLWKYGYPALGVPGKSLYRKLRLEHVEGYERVFLHEDAGEAGAQFVGDVAAHLRSLRYGGEIRAIQFGPHQDVSALHVSLGEQPDDAAFLTAYEAIREAASIVEPSAANTAKADAPQRTEGKEAPRVVQLVGADTIPPAEREYG
jgi:hypothetical protein